MNARDAMRRAEGQLAAAGVEAPRLEARLLVGAAVGMREFWSADHILDPDIEQRLAGFVRRRLAHEPLAYILGRKEFWSLDLCVGPGVLVPRPETELLIEELGREFPDRSAPLHLVDFGTGSGNLLVAALMTYPQATGVGIDRSQFALEWARHNVERHALEQRCVLLHQDWTLGTARKADAVLANPPYIREAELQELPPDVGGHEPASALSGGPDGLAAYRSLAPRIAHTLKPEGSALLEIGAGQATSVSAVLSESGLEVLRVAADLAGIPRCIVCGIA